MVPAGSLRVISTAANGSSRAASAGLQLNRPTQGWFLAQGGQLGWQADGGRVRKRNVERQACNGGQNTGWISSDFPSVA